MVSPPRVRMSGPLAAHHDLLWAELLERGYSLFSAYNLVLVAADLSRWLEDASLSAPDLDRARVDEYVRHRRDRGHKLWITPRGLSGILDPLRTLGAIPPAEPEPVPSSPTARLLHDFETYLVQQRGLRPATAANYRGQGRSILASLGVSHPSELERLSPDVVSRFMVRESRFTSAVHLKFKVTVLRSLLRYLHVQGLCRDLSAAVPAVARPRLAGLPKAIREEDVRRIEESCDRATTTGRRDYAMMLLLSRLGLRATEVAALNLDDVHWSRGEMVVRAKGAEGILPLPQEVGEAISVYLKEDRPVSTSRRLFLGLPAPHREITANAMQGVVRNACRRAGLAPVGSHCLRHTAATSMLRRGASLPEIAQVLRHRALETTAIYAKVDQLALHPVARPWPGGVA